MRKCKIEITVYEFEELDEGARRAVWHNYHQVIHSVSAFKIKALCTLAKEGIEAATVYTDYPNGVFNSFSFVGIIPVHIIQRNAKFREFIEAACTNKFIDDIKECCSYIRVIRSSNYTPLRDNINIDIDNSSWMDCDDYNKFAQAVLNWVKSISDAIEREGFIWHTEYDPKAVAIWASDNNLEFLADGRIFSESLKTLS